MSAEQNKALVRRFFDEMCNGRKLNIAGELFSANHIYHDPQTPAGPGPEGMKQVIGTYQMSFPDAHWDVLETIAAENDTVVTRWIGKGKNDIGLMGMPATGKRVNVEGIWMHRIANGKIVESWDVWDTLGMLQQMGVVPMMGNAKVTAEKRN
jgi:steroid delta-isomerase-like uncharacterized protein